MIRCTDCGRRFGGAWGYKLAHPVTLGRCRTVEELRAVGLRRNRHGVWVRRHSRFQARLVDGRVGPFSLVRRLFGRSYRSLSPEERARYRRVLRATRTASKGATGRERNAHALSGIEGAGRPAIDDPDGGRRAD